MPDITVRTVIDRDPTDVWNYVKNIASHTEWMVDAAEIRFITEQQSGVGVSFECDTEVGPLKLMDVMTITSWIPEQEMGVRHEGAVVGEGVFRLRPVGTAATEFSWEESLVFPWWMGSRIGSRAARPVLKAIWKRNLRTLKEQVERR